MKQRVKFEDGKKNVMNIGNIIQTYQVCKGYNNKTHYTVSYITIGKAMKSATDKVDFYKFMESKDETKKDFLSIDKNYILGSKRPHGRRGYYEAITENCKINNYWINWPANCTGDLPSMSAAILMGFKHGINVDQYGNIDSESRLTEVRAYLGGVIDKDDNHFIINANGWKGTYGQNISNGLKFSWLTRVVATGKYQDDKSGKEEVVKNVGYEEKDKDHVRNTWLKDNADVEIENFLNLHYQLTPGMLRKKSITILWIRKSGERGGAHFENDTSFKALKRYIENYTAGLIILAGDKKGIKTNKLVGIAQARVYDFTEFWNIPGVGNWGGNTRTGQLKLYDYLNRISGNNLKHIGSMSGGLEALALIGHNVYFKAKEGEVGVDRMKQYQNTRIKYKRINFDSWNPFGYNYAGFEKSAAKYFVFFSSGVIQGRVEEADLMKVYKEKYNPKTNYKIAGGGLSGNNATAARTVSKKLAKDEKLQLEKHVKKMLSKQKEKNKKIEMFISKGINPNRQTRKKVK